MERFSVWADWILGSAVTDDLLRRVTAAWPAEDLSLCPGPKRGDPEVLQLIFELEAEDFATAATQARITVQDLASGLGLPGHLAPLNAYTETHSFREE
jgi:hypothetical protein